MRSTRLKIVLLVMLVVLPVISLGVYWVAGALSGSPVARYYEPIQQQLRGKSGGSFRLVYVVTRGGSRLAEYGDLAPGATTTSDGAVIPFALSAQMSKAGAIRLDAPLKHYKADQINPYLERMLTRTRNEPSQDERRKSFRPIFDLLVATDRETGATRDKNGVDVALKTGLDLGAAFSELSYKQVSGEGALLCGSGGICNQRLWDIQWARVFRLYNQLETYYEQGSRQHYDPNAVSRVVRDGAAYTAR